MPSYIESFSVATVQGNIANEDRWLTAHISLEPMREVFLAAVIDGHGGPDWETIKLVNDH